MRINKVTYNTYKKQQVTPPYIPEKNINFNGVYIPSDSNKHIKYLYNNVLDIVKQNKIPAMFGTKGIDLPSVTKNIIDKIKELGIIFIDKQK